MDVRTTVGKKIYTEEEAIKQGLISKKESELVEKIAKLVKGNLRTSKRGKKKNSRKRR